MQTKQMKSKKKKKNYKISHEWPSHCESIELKFNRRKSESCHGNELIRLKESLKKTKKNNFAQTYKIVKFK